MKLKKAAMFGLDARIALAIFGALSVISGAALYSAIDKSNIAAFVEEALDVGKAWDAYYFDTGRKVAKLHSDPANTSYYYMVIEDLIKNPGVSGWGGPYLNRKINTSSTFEHDNDKIISTSLGFFRNPSIESFNNIFCVSGTKDCALWVQHAAAVGALPATFYESIDRYIDGTLNPTAGNFRYKNNSSNVYTYSFIKYTDVPNPVDNP